MSVYIGHLHSCLGRPIVCHMVADTISELHEMAGLIGIDQYHFQNENKCFPHYDVSMWKRRFAVKLGAIEAIERKLTEVLKEAEYGRDR